MSYNLNSKEIFDQVKTGELLDKKNERIAILKDSAIITPKLEKALEASK